MIYKLDAYKCRNNADYFCRKVVVILGKIPKITSRNPNLYSAYKC